MKGITSPWNTYPNHLYTPSPPDDKLRRIKWPLYHDSARDQMTPEAEESQETDHVNNMEVPTHVNAHKDDFQNTIRQKLGKELSEALSREDTNGQPLTKLERLTKTVKPVYEESWNTQRKGHST